MTNRVVLSASALKISKSGYDVLTETDEGHLSFNSAYGGLGVRASGTLSVASGADGSVSFSDDGYIPFAFVTLELSGTQQQGPYFFLSGSGNQGHKYKVTRTALTVHNYESSTKTFHYVIFYFPVS